MRRQTIVKNCYALQEQVAQGSLTTTWRATALYSPDTFALTFLTFRYDAVPQATFDAFTRVFTLLSRSQSRYLLTPFEYDEWDGTKYLAMPWIGDETLGSVLETGRVVDTDRVIDIIIHLLRGLAELERIGVRHDALDPDAVMIGSVHARVRTTGVSVFATALRSQPAPARERAHERDLVAVGAMIGRLAAAGNHADAGKLKRICDEFQTAPGTLGSIAAALDRVLSAYPEKRTVDLIGGHATDLQQRDDHAGAPYHGHVAQERHGTTTWTEPDRDRYRSRQDRGPDRVPPSEAVTAASEPPSVSDRAPGGTFTHVLSTIRRLFTRKPGAPRRGARKAAPIHDDAHIARFQPSPPNEPAAPSTAGPHRGDTGGGEREAWSRPPHRGETAPADNGRILELFRRLSEHFRGVPPQAGPRFRYDTRPKRPRRSSRRRAVLRAQRDREAFSGERRARDPAERYEPRHATSSRRSQPTTAAGGQDPIAWRPDRAAASPAHDHDVRPGPEHAPGERRRGLEDGTGAHRDVDFDSGGETERRVVTPNAGSAAAFSRAGKREESAEPAVVDPGRGLGVSTSVTGAGGAVSGGDAEVNIDSTEERAASSRRRRAPANTDRAEPISVGSRGRPAAGRRSWFARVVSFVRKVGRRVRRALIGPWS